MPRAGAKKLPNIATVRHDLLAWYDRHLGNHAAANHGGDGGPLFRQF